MKETSTIIYGRIPVITCLKAQRRKVFKLYIQEGVKLPELHQFISVVPTEYKQKSFLDKITKSGVHQGIVAEVENLFVWRFDEWYRTKANMVEDIVILDHIEDPRNFGAIIRSAVAFDLDSILFTREGSAPLTPITVKASAGAVEYATLVEIHSTPRVLRRLKEIGFKVVALDKDGEVTINGVKWHEKNILIIGSEGKGIRPVVKNFADLVVAIPTSKDISQLNASVSAGIAFYVMKNHKVK
ncbi:MAG: 23S rRNA (guanosine(2251)-2'-O)-methyltransferase RlmB [Candidatus Hydrogenedentes bacterium]|nr:23S rRNA (guanosine(2251)-2'-O)-methyltransferase RlmB [Candidatus Hydrogenedentota bacterium]